MNYHRSWYQFPQIKKEHDFPITQVYCWLITKDLKIALVSKDNLSWQFPGGHPMPNETLAVTTIRELKEELSLDLEKLKVKPIFFGYYVIEEIDDKGKIIKSYLQLRSSAVLNNEANKHPICPHEEETDEEQIRYARWVSIDQAKKFIPWLKQSEELTSFLTIIHQ